MPCFHPLDAWQCSNGDVVFVDNLRRNDIVRSLSLPCGRCVGCRLERSRQWAVRCMHEASLHMFNSFVTLTYDEDHLPEFNSLNYKHYQDFMKRLRKRFDGVRFYMCGEYGENFSRPHYHAILFNCFFSDRKKHSVGDSGATIFTSETLNNLWPFGFASIGDVTFESAAYVARYVMKKVTGDAADEHYSTVDPLTGEISRRVPEFNRMSLKPGIGGTWIRRYNGDVYPRDVVVARGVECKPPRYYDKFLQSSDVDCLEDVKFKRYTRAMLNAKESFPDRLAVREEVTKARISSLSRKL
nr:MAG: replication initiator protein [Microvirus sp.]